MTFRDWQQLPPEAAAREIHQRARTRLSSAQQRAVIAQLDSESELTKRFAAAADDRRPLARVPFFAKDLFDVAHVPTFAGSTFLPEVRATRANHSAFVDAIVHRGAVLAGKTHMHEFAYGVTGENAHYGDCEHPQFPGRTTGGSSSGSVAAVAAGIVPFSLGSDTGGSVRVPAAFCGLYGFRLTPRDPWINDAVALAPSYDTAGWFTTNARDMCDAVDALVGLHKADRVPRGCYLEMPGLDAEVTSVCRAASARFCEAADTTTREQLARAFASAVDAYNTTVALEAWEVHRTWAERYKERYSPLVWQRLNRVHSVTTQQVELADVTTSLIRRTWDEFFETFDFLVMAASPTPALTKAECTLENRMRILTLTAPASIGGRPALTFPVKLASGLTTGLQIIVNQPQSPAVEWALRRELG
jgi:aspartyl-tRNA(Asn)/glutamyl-tRNA(Gln) amidotransferase subunit A